MQDTLPPLARVFTIAPALAGTMRITIENSRGAWPGDNVNNCANGYGCGDPVLPAISPFGPTSRFVDVSPSGPRGFTFNVTSFAPWLVVQNGSGALQSNSVPHRIEVGVDWSKFPADAAGMQNGVLLVRSSVGDGVNITLPAIKTSVPAGFEGFVEGDGVVVRAKFVRQQRGPNMSGSLWRRRIGRATLPSTTWHLQPSPASGRVRSTAFQRSPDCQVTSRPRAAEYVHRANLRVTADRFSVAVDRIRLLHLQYADRRQQHER